MTYQERLRKYEATKRKLIRDNLTPDQYEQAVRRAAKKLRI